MKVFIVAPKFCTPWTEGRKKFIRDLLDAAAGRWRIAGLVTEDAGESAPSSDVLEVVKAERSGDHVVRLLARLPSSLERHRPDLVCFFPFGVFSGLRGLANLWLIRSVQRICAKAGVPCCTLMYSLTEEATSRFHRSLLKEVYYNQFSGEARTIRFGVKLPPALERPRELVNAREPVLLFMSGAAEESLERLDYVLDVRGLRLLLRAGEALSGMGFRLVVAVPFLKSATLRARLESHEDNLWEAGRVTWLTEVKVPEVYANVDAFVFPYNQEERQFVPTSMVEAMHFGIPVVFPRLGFLEFFHAPVEQGLVFEPGDIADLIARIVRLKEEPDAVRELSERARAYVARQFDIHNTLTDIEEVGLSLRVSQGVSE